VFRVVGVEGYRDVRRVNLVVSAYRQRERETLAFKELVALLRAEYPRELAAASGAPDAAKAAI